MTTLRFLIVATVAVVGGACSGSDEPADATGDDETVTSEVGETDGTDAVETESETVETAETVDSDETVDSAESDAADDDSAAFCDQIRALNESSEVEDDLARAAEEFSALVDDAPDDLRDDLEIVSDAFSELIDLDVEDPDSFATIFEVFGRPEVIEASEKLEQFGVDECGLDPTEDSGSDIEIGDDDADDGSGG